MNINNTMNLMGERIKERRKMLGLTQAYLGDRLHVASATVSKWEKGQVYNIKRPMLIKLAAELQCEPTYLLAYEEITADLILTDEERNLVIAFRKQPDAVKDAIRKMLDLDAEKKGVSYVS